MVSATFLIMYKCNILSGKACFVIDVGKIDGTQVRGQFNSEPMHCAKCYPKVRLSSAQHTLVHNGSHILFDPTINRSDQPCALCMRPFPICKFELTKTEATGTVRQIDWSRSNCMNRLQFKMSVAKKSTKQSPCTNHLLPCPLQCGRNIWTYNLDAHYRYPPHNLVSLDNIPRVYQLAEGEFELMEQVYADRQNVPQRRNLKKKNTQTPLLISAAHRASNALKECVGSISLFYFLR